VQSLTIVFIILVIKKKIQEHVIRNITLGIVGGSTEGHLRSKVVKLESHHKIMFCTVLVRCFKPNQITSKMVSCGEHFNDIMITLFHLTTV
jgi:hypothetical protein